MIISLKKINVILIGIIYSLVYFGWLFFYFNNGFSYNTNSDFLIFWIFLSFGIELFVFLCIKKVKFYDFGLWFIVLSNLFMFGRIIGKYFGFESSVWDPTYLYSSDDICKTVIYLIPAIFLFCLGYNFCDRNAIDKNKKVVINSNLTFYCGIALTVTGGFFRLICDIPTMIYMSNTNTYTSFSNFSMSGILYSFSALFIPGIIFLLSSKKVKNKNMIFILTILYLSLTMILTGSRKQQIFDIITIMLCKIYNSKNKLNLKKILAVTIFGYVFFNLIYVIREYRTNLGLIPSKFIDSLFSLNMISNLIGETFGEIGLILYSVVNIVYCVPKIFPYQLGTTFFRTFFSFLPINPFVGNFFSNASSTNVINKYLSIPAGSSMFGDLYWNFGYMGGIVASFVFGIILFNLFNYYDTQKNEFNMSVYFSLFSILMVLVRAEFIDCWRTLVYLLLIIYFIKSCLKIHKKN